MGLHRCSAPRGWPGETRVLPELLCKGWENQSLSAAVLDLLRHHLPLEMLLFPNGCAPAVSHHSRRNSSCVVLGFLQG